MQIDYGHIIRLKIKEDTIAKRLLPDDWSYDGDNVNTMNYTPITLECTGNGNCLYNINFTFWIRRPLLRTSFKMHPRVD